MRIFTALGIIFIVCGHLSCEVFTIGGLFPYYSFHVFIFLFVSGYFYDPLTEEHPGKYILHKAKTLLLPYFIYNLIYGILSTHLDYQEIYLGSGISWWNMFIEPFLGGHQFGLNSPAWYVPALFVVLTINILARKALSALFACCRKSKEGNEQAEELNRKIMPVTDIIMLLGSLAAGILTIYLAIGGHVYDYLKTPGRFLIMLPGIQFGRCYKTYLETKFEDLRKKIGEVKYHALLFAVILIIQYFLSFRLGNLAFGVVWCSNFGNGPFVPYITVITGMSFWLLISKLLARLSLKTKCLNFLLWVGRGSYHIMTNHFSVLLIINLVCRFLSKSRGFNLGFEEELFAHDFTYQCLYASYHGTRIINVILCVSIPTIIYMLVVKIRRRCGKIGL